MTKTLSLEVVTPQKSALNIAEIESLVVPASEGYLGILPDHAPIITGLRPGTLKYRMEGKDNFLAISGGFMEVSQNRITILADTAERPEEIDKARALAAKERAEKRLKERTPGLDLVRAEMALKRALSRLDVLDRKY